MEGPCLTTLWFVDDDVSKRSRDINMTKTENLVRSSTELLFMIKKSKSNTKTKVYRVIVEPILLTEVETVEISF